MIGEERGGQVGRGEKRGEEEGRGIQVVCVLTNKSPRYCKLKLVLFGKERDDLGEDGLALYLAVCCLGHNARPHLNLLAHLGRGGRGGEG